METKSENKNLANGYQLPPIDLLNDYEPNGVTVTEEELIANKDKIVKTLNDYKIQIATINATVGPTVTLYEIRPANGTRITKIRNISEDIMLSLAVLGVRVIAPIPGRGTIGIEVPNKSPQTVAMRAVLASKKFKESKFELPIAIGQNIDNSPFIFDLTKAPHLLIAGAAGQGKTVALNAIITSLLYTKTPEQLKLVLIDPKMVELSPYKPLERYFLAKQAVGEDAIVTNAQDVVNTLQSLCIEMDLRYDMLKNSGCRNIREYNQEYTAHKLNPEHGNRYLPYIVVVMDEFADLITELGIDIELPIARLAQLARAVGIHLIITTQKPSSRVVTGLIKANFPARIAFRVMSLMDSRTILDTPGANQLIGRGDMLVSMGCDVARVQCAFVENSEIKRIVEYVSSQPSTPYILPEYEPEYAPEKLDVDLSKRDSFFEDAARIVVISRHCSIALLQRAFCIGYKRASSIMAQLEAAGIVELIQKTRDGNVLIPNELALEDVLNKLPKDTECE